MRGPDDDIFEGLPVDDDEGPTRTLDPPRRPQAPARPAPRMPSGPGVRPPAPPPPPDRRQAPTRSAAPSGGLPGRRSIPSSELPSFGSLVESEEALRVFDEMGKVDGGMSTFTGSQTEESRIETLPPFTPGEANNEPATVEVSFSDIRDDAGVPPPPPTAPDLAEHVDMATFRDAWLVYEHCPCPLFRLDAAGRIQLLNPAFCQFLGAMKQDILGMALYKTRLGRIYPDLEDDVDGCLATRAPLQRLVSYEAGNQTVRFLLWIVPFPRSAGRSNAFAGIILPYPGDK